MRLRNVILLLAPVLVFSMAAKAQEESVPANDVFGFLGMSRSPELAGMAGAGSALTSRTVAFSAFDNPAVLPASVGKVDASVAYGHTTSNNICGGVAARLGGGFAVSLAVVDQI